MRALFSECIHPLPHLLTKSSAAVNLSITWLGLQTLAGYSNDTWPFPRIDARRQQPRHACCRYHHSHSLISTFSYLICSSCRILLSDSASHITQSIQSFFFIIPLSLSQGDQSRTVITLTSSSLGKCGYPPMWTLYLARPRRGPIISASSTICLTHFFRFLGSQLYSLIYTLSHPESTRSSGITRQPSLAQPFPLCSVSVTVAQ